MYKFGAFEGSSFNFEMKSVSSKEIPILSGVIMMIREVLTFIVDANEICQKLIICKIVVVSSRKEIKFFYKNIPVNRLLVEYE